ncbi:hypothetical protein H0X06_05720 [Candidatus Dependentiae bacterium]|nr:hypothetical protein [Candidatus Dependentiae bacterium]
MKRYVVAGLLCVSSIVGSLNCVNVNEGELLTAIRDNDEEKVQLLLLETPLFEIESKGRLLAATSSSVEEWHKSLSLVNSGRDFLAFGSGAAIAIAGLMKLYGASCSGFLLFFGAKEKDMAEGLQAHRPGLHPKESLQEQAGELGIDGLLFSGLGYHLIKRGYNCVSALKSFRKAKRIQGLIEKSPYVILTTNK